jgi:membrane protease YdiL (CAAX protease family)
MDILTLKLREDLRKHNQAMRAHWTARWRWLQLLVLICGLLIALYTLLPPSWPLQPAVYLFLFAPLLLLAGLQPFIHATRRPDLLTGVISFVYIILSLAAAILNPAGPAGDLLLPDWSIWFSLAIPVLSWGILIWLFLAVPAQSRQYRLRFRPVFVNLIIGIGVGLATVLHMYLVSYFIPAVEFPKIQFSDPGLLWSFCVLAGIVVPAEELIFRGAAFSILYDELNLRFSDVVVRITAINLLVYLVIVASSQMVQPFVLLSLIYRAGLSACCLFLVLRRRSLAPALLANLIFSIATGWSFAL